MKIVKSILPVFTSMLIITMFFGACEYEEPFPDPSADFTLWGVNSETNVYEQVQEPLVLEMGVAYDFIVEGTGQQFVFWFGQDGDPEMDTPTGSNFNDRGINHYSRGTIATDMMARKSFAEEGEYEVVLVASSYSYSLDEYKESLTTKTVTVEAK